MKNNIKRNFILGLDEEIYKEFPKLKGLHYFCQVIITNKRLVIYTHGKVITNKKQTIKRGMNEVERKSISKLEYYLEYTKYSFYTKLIGAVFIIGALILAYGLFANILAGFVYPYSEIINYVVLGIFFIIGIILLFGRRKVLHFKAISGFNNETHLELKPTKYNELALRYIASRFY